MIDNQPLLDELLALLATVNRINRNLMQKEGHSRPAGLSAIQMHAMIAMRCYGVLNMSELAAHLLVTRPQLTKVVDGLVELGFFRRKINPESRREVLIELSDEGRSYIEQMGKGRFLSRVLAAASEEDVQELILAIRTMRRIFAQADMEPPPPETGIST